MNKSVLLCFICIICDPLIALNIFLFLHFQSPEKDILSQINLHEINPR